MKKLLQINSVANTGSTGKIAEDIGDFVISKGWESFIAFGRQGNESNSELIKFGHKLSHYNHFFLTRAFDRHGFGSQRATEKLIERVNVIKPDIIHLHNLHGYYINIKILFNYLASSSTPVIWTLHDCWAFTGHCAHFDRVKCFKWKSLCSQCPQTSSSYPTSLLLDNSKRNFLDKKKLFNSKREMTLVPVSNWLNDHVEESFLGNIPTKVIHNGLDTQKFNIKKTNNLQSKYGIKGHFVILGVANIWHRIKGLDDFITLSKEISSKQKIILVGLNDKQLKSLPANIIGLKRTDSIDQLCELYSLADVFVNPTYEDSFGMTNLEALACGTPVITYNTGGTPETISRQTGFVVDQGDIKGLLNCINEVKKRGKSNFSQACRNRAEVFFERNKKYIEYFDLYNISLNR